MQFELKALSSEGIILALARAEKYRLLNEPTQAESICLDILRTDPTHQEATIFLLLSLTDQFDDQAGDYVARAHEVLNRLEDEYQRAYYGGLICERQARCYLKRSSPGSGFTAFNFFEQAMTLYERAELLRPPGNDEAVLRWNSCARTIMDHRLEPESADDFRPMLE